MKLLASLRALCSSRFRNKQIDAEMDEEMRLHIQNRADDLERSGLSRGEAERRARIEFGAVERFKEEVRETAWVTHLDSLFRDFLCAIRSLRKDRRLVGTTVFALALGIGAATVAFSAFYNLLFNAFAAKDAGRLVVLSLQSTESGAHPEYSLQPMRGSLSDIDAMRRQSRAFEDVIGFGRGIELLNDGQDSHQVYVGYVTGNAFNFYGVRPLLGRGILPEDAKPAAAPIFVMNYRTWVGAFAAAPNIVGRKFFLNHVLAGEWALHRGVLQVDVLGARIGIDYVHGGGGDCAGVGGDWSVQRDGVYSVAADAGDWSADGVGSAAGGDFANGAAHRICAPGCGDFRWVVCKLWADALFEKPDLGSIGDGSVDVWSGGGASGDNRTRGLFAACETRGWRRSVGCFAIRVRGTENHSAQARTCFLIDHARTREFPQGLKSLRENLTDNSSAPKGGVQLQDLCRT